MYFSNFLNTPSNDIEPKSHAYTKLNSIRAFSDDFWAEKLSLKQTVKGFMLHKAHTVMLFKQVSA